MSYVTSKLDLLRLAFGTYENSSDGINYAFKCPKCCKPGSEKKKLVVRLDNEAYHCWVCDLKGKSFQFLFRKYKPAFLGDYEKIKGVNIYSPIKDLSIEEESVHLPNGFIFLATNFKHVDPDVNAVIQYAHSRDLSIEDFWRFRLGTCIKGRYRRRLIVPSFNDEGKLNYFVARTIDSNAFRKYINPRVAKKKVIFNEMNISWSNEITLVEGAFDMMKCDENVTCLLGSSLGYDYEIFKKIVKNQTPVLLALDADAESKTHACAKLLSEFGISVRILDVEGYDDVGSMSKEEFMIRKKKAIMWSSSKRLHHLIRKIKSGSII